MYDNRIENEEHKYQNESISNYLIHGNEPNYLDWPKKYYLVI